MAAKAYLSLQESERAVLHAASRIFAAYVANSSVTADNEKAALDKSLALAIALAKRTDEAVQSDEEMG